jgi:hypothetical protein
MGSCNRSQLILDIDTSGFEEGIRDMKPGGKRRIIIPPELGPPVSYCLCLHSMLELIYFLSISMVALSISPCTLYCSNTLYPLPDIRVNRDSVKEINHHYSSLCDMLAA